MSDLGKMLVLAGAVVIVAGIALMLVGRANIPLGRLPGTLFIAARTLRFISAGHVNTDQRGAFGGALPDWTLSGIRTSYRLSENPRPSVAGQGTLPTLSSATMRVDAK